MHFCFLEGHLLIHRFVDIRLSGQLVNEAYERMKLFQFWLAFNGLRWPTDLVSYRQVDATDWIFIFCNLLSNYR